MAQGMGMTQEWADEIAKEQEEYKWQAAHQPKPVQIDTQGLMRKSSDPKLAQRQAELLAQVFSLQAEIDSVSKAVAAAEVTDLKKQHKILWAQARKALDSLKASAKPIAASENVVRECGFEWNREFAKLTQVHGSIPPAATYPTPEEYEAWESRIEKQKEKLQEVEDRQKSAEQELAQLQFEQNVLRADFDEAKAAVDASQARIDRLEGKKSAPSSINFTNSMGLQG